MGRMINDSTTFDILGQLNKRFCPDEIAEMVALQKEFGIFSTKHTLQDSFALLGIVPCDLAERKRWYRFLDHLKSYKSDLPNVNGHDRVVKAYADALKARPHFPPIPPLPVFVDVHLAADDARVTVSQSRPLVFSVQTYVVVSIPTTPGQLARQQAAAAAKERRAKKGAK